MTPVNPPRLCLVKSLHSSGAAVCAAISADQCRDTWHVHDQTPNLCQIIPCLDATSIWEGKGLEQPEGTLPPHPRHTHASQARVKYSCSHKIQKYASPARAEGLFP